MSTARTSERRGCGVSLLNIMAVMLLMAGLVIALGIAVIFLAPDLVANTPFAVLTNIANTAETTETVDLPTAVPVAVLPSATATATPNMLVPTWTPAAIGATATPLPLGTLRPSATPTDMPSFPTKTPTNTPTATPTETPTPTPLGPTATPSPTRSQFPFTKSDTSPFYLQNYANNAGCDWLGVAGEVLDLALRPVTPGAYVVHVWGSGVDSRVPVGGAPAYSPSGWEQFVHNEPLIRDYNVQLETTSGTPVSQIYAVQTRASCNQNLVRLDFVQNH